MLRPTALLLLALLLGCGGSRQPSSTNPAPESAAASPEQHADGAFALPPAPRLDTLIPPEELAA